MVNKPKIIKASLISPFFSLLPMGLLGGGVILGELLNIPGLSSTGDAPARAAGLILFAVIPLGYPVLSVLMCVTGYCFKYFDVLTRRNLYIICLIASFIVGIYFGWQSTYGIKDQLISVSVFSSLTLFSLLIGAFIWWKIAMARSNDKIPA